MRDPRLIKAQMVQLPVADVVSSLSHLSVPESVSIIDRITGELDSFLI